jgi:hypothetical protein
MNKTKGAKPSPQYQAVVLLRRSNAATSIPSAKRKTRTQAKRDWKKDA